MKSVSIGPVLSPLGRNLLSATLNASYAKAETTRGLYRRHGREISKVDQSRYHALVKVYAECQILQLMLLISSTKHVIARSSLVEVRSITIATAP